MAGNQEVRIGYISSFDVAKGVASVYYPDRSGMVIQNIKVFAPLGCKQVLMKDDQVLVLHLSNGGEAGVVLGKIVDGGGSIAALGGDIAFAGAAGTITLSELIQIKNKVL